MPGSRPYEHKKRHFFKIQSDKIVFTVTIVLAAFIVFFAIGVFDPAFPQFWQGYYGQIKNPYPHLNITEMDIEIDLRSHTFGSLIDINAETRVYPRDLTPEYLPKFYRIWFDGSKSCLTDDPILEQYNSLS